MSSQSPEASPPTNTTASSPTSTDSSPPPPPPPDTNSVTPPASPVSTNGSQPIGPLLPKPPKPPGLSREALAGLIVGAALGAIIVLIAVGICFFFYMRKKRREGEGIESRPSKGERNMGLHLQLNNHPHTNNKLSIPRPTAPPGVSPMFDHELQSTSSSSGFENPFALVSPGSNAFTYKELSIATNGFSSDNLVGQGGFGYVHKGVLSDGRVVAIKQLKAGSGQGEREFQAEIEIITRVHHRHLVSLIGYCMTGVQRMLVYEFVPNNTLEFHLHRKEGPPMDWSTRMKIAVGSAKGLAYLHEDCRPKIIHRDIKASNILLDDNFEAKNLNSPPHVPPEIWFPKVADFGLAKYSLDTDTHVSTRVMGTFGYLAPEYASSGKLSEKSDVFSFGVVLLELITGRRPVDRSQSYIDDSIVDWARPLLKQALEEGIFDALVDPKLEDYDSTEMIRMMSCAAVCIRHSARLRPRMGQIVRALEGNLSLDDLSDGLTPGHSMIYDSYGSSNYNSIQYKGDLNKFRKLALESQELASSECSGATSDYGLHHSSTSTEGKQTAQEVVLQVKETTLKDPHDPKKVDDNSVH